MSRTVTCGVIASPRNAVFRPTGNVFFVEGLVVNDFANASPGSGLNVNLGVEAVREFRVITNEYTAEYGRSTGGVVTAIFKSGTNDFHGNAFEFLRNSALDARNFFDVQKPEFHRQPVRRLGGRTDQEEPDVLLRRLRGAAREQGHFAHVGHAVSRRS